MSHHSQVLSTMKAVRYFLNSPCIYDYYFFSQGGARLYFPLDQWILITQLPGVKGTIAERERERDETRQTSRSLCLEEREDPGTVVSSFLPSLCLPHLLATSSSHKLCLRPKTGRVKEEIATDRPYLVHIVIRTYDQDKEICLFVFCFFILLDFAKAGVLIVENEGGCLLSCERYESKTWLQG